MVTHSTGFVKDTQLRKPLYYRCEKVRSMQKQDAVFLFWSRAPQYPPLAIAGDKLLLSSTVCENSCSSLFYSLPLSEPFCLAQV